MKGRVEEAEFDSSFREECMKVNAMVTIVGGTVPDTFHLVPGEIFVLLQGLHKIVGYWSTPSVSSFTDGEGVIDDVLPGCHKVAEAPE